MHRKTIQAILLAALIAAIALPAAARSVTHTYELSPTHVGYMTRSAYEDQNPWDPDPYFTLHPNSTANWGKDRSYSEWAADWWVKEWRAYLNFPVTNYLHGYCDVLSASFYYGVDTFVTGGPGLPEFWRLNLYDGGYTYNLHESDWYDGQHAAGYMFPTNPGSTWIGLNDAAIARLNFAVPYDWGICIRDASNASEEGFYGALARHCKLRITIRYYNNVNISRPTKSAAQNEDMTFGQVKSLYR